MSDKVLLTTDELYQLLKRSALPTVLVEGKDDIIFYRRVEEDLQDFGVDMLSAGNKGAVLELYRKISESPISAPVVFVVDKDLWVHEHYGLDPKNEGVITTIGYSVENDLYVDGDLESLLNLEEKQSFLAELEQFTHWYALAVDRAMRGDHSTFRTHPGKILDDVSYFGAETALRSGESYPDNFLAEIRANYSRVLRGKSLFALLGRKLSSKRREIKFGGRQLMEFGASRRGENYTRLASKIRTSLVAVIESKSNKSGA
ncbi:DUF4435 domain-containing protein [Pseudomonas sp. LJDD11]|uniref:DUF4435 domain-containing protein n=1 Tax=Pseudomonas sp. LJDD11 TaxID=2931984 RepID=UPI00211C785E|nr:DUF4435 domain-containing protein [Pseudomonas sp. LJDD11]MCQ9423391.1 DUF4435 domain-containing protein [Pseudomonas sp. LJDD11]